MKFSASDNNKSEKIYFRNLFSFMLWLGLHLRKATSFSMLNLLLFTFIDNNTEVQVLNYKWKLPLV